MDRAVLEERPQSVGSPDLLLRQEPMSPLAADSGSKTGAWTGESVATCTALPTEHLGLAKGRESQAC